MLSSTCGRAIRRLAAVRFNSSSSSSSSYELPPPTWSLKELNLTADEPVSEDELKRLAKRALISLDDISDTDGLRQDLADMMACLNQVNSIDLPDMTDAEIYDMPRGLTAGAPVRKSATASKAEEAEAKEVWDKLLSQKVTKRGSHDYFAIVTKKEDK